MLLNCAADIPGGIVRKILIPPRLRLCMAHYNFKPGWVPSLATALLLPLFVSLGMWQLHRAKEKESLHALRLARRDAPEFAVGGPQGLPELDRDRYRRVVIEGVYEAEQQILLDNQIVGHQPGYFVFTPLRLSGREQRILVNRGWVAGIPDRSSLPEVPVSAVPRGVRGTIDKFPAVGWRLRGAEIPTPGWPAVVQLLDAAALAQHLGYPVAAYQVLLDPAEPEGYIREWKAADPDAGKNRGYALQWFSFAAILAVLFIRFGFKPSTGGSPSTETTSRDL